MGTTRALPSALNVSIQTRHDPPLSLCCLHRILSWNAPNDQKALVFASVFVIVWVGSAVITVNALLLGGSL